MIITSYTGRSVNIDLKGYNDIQEVSEKNVIIGIRNNGSRIIWTGDTVYTEDMGWHRVNTIKKVSEKVYRASSMERTDTSMMILPLFGGTRHDMCYNDHFMNAFIYHEEYDWQDNIIWVLMKKPLTPDVRFSRAISILRSTNRCVKEEEMGSCNILFTMKIPTLFEKDFSMFKMSKFSKMSDNAKNMIYRFHENQGQSDSQLQMQLTKNPIYKKKLEDMIGETLPNDAELHSAIDDQRECFRYEYIIEDIR